MNTTPPTSSPTTSSPTTSSPPTTIWRRRRGVAYRDEGSCLMKWMEGHAPQPEARGISIHTRSSCRIAWYGIAWMNEWHIWMNRYHNKYWGDGWIVEWIDEWMDRWWIEMDSMA
jgi:hypothetical protein